jgi:hypothetical protein
MTLGTNRSSRYGGRMKSFGRMTMTKRMRAIAKVDLKLRQRRKMAK